MTRSDVPRRRPYFRRLVVEADGHLWVQRDDGFDVFGPEGAFVGDVALPMPLETMPAAEIHGDYLYGATRDSLDVPRAVRLRIVR